MLLHYHASQFNIPFSMLALAETAARTYLVLQIEPRPLGLIRQRVFKVTTPKVVL